MATTTNYGWETPDDTDLVKDGASAMRTLGQSIDTTFAELKGGTSGQMLTKASNTDNDYTGVTPQSGDITAITATSPLTGGGTTGDVTIGIQAGSTTQSGALQLTDSTSSTSTTTAATPNSVKASYDLANGAIPKTTATTAGDILYRNGSTITRLGIGTAGQVLTVNSGATAPEWAASAGSGGMTLISTTSLSGSSVTLSSIPSTYKNLQLIIRGYKDNDNGNGAWVRMNGDSTSNRHGQFIAYGGTFNNSWNATRWDLGQNQLNTVSTSLYIMDLYDYANSTTFKLSDIRSIAQHYTTTTNFNIYQTSGVYNQTTAISSLQIGPTGGTSMIGGTAYLYGVN